MTVDLTRKVVLNVQEAEAILRLGAGVAAPAADERRALERIADQLRKLRRREAAL